MIGKIKVGTGFRGALDYNMREEKGDLIFSNMSGKTSRELAAEFGTIRSLRPNVSRAVFHTSINAAPGESITTDQWRAIGERVLSEMGFTDNQALIFQHTDTDHSHIHIVANRIKNDGGLVSDAKDFKRIDSVMRGIEKDFGLQAVESSSESQRRAPSKNMIEKFTRTGEVPTITQLQQLCDAAAHECGSISDYEKRLQLAGVELIPFVQMEGAKLSGLMYRLGDVVMKGSDLGKKYSPSGLAKNGVTYDKDRDYAAISACIEREKSRVSRANELTANDGIASSSDRAVDGRDAANVEADQRDRSALGEARSATPEGREKQTVDARELGRSSGTESEIERVSRLVQVAAQPAKERDLSEKTTAWKAQRDALGAASYSVIMREKSGKTRTLDEAYSGEQIEKMLPSLRTYEQRGRDILIRPYHEKHRYITLHGIDAARLDALKLAGYSPSLVMSAAHKKVDITLQVARADDAATEEAAAAISEQFNADRYDIDAPLPAAGFKIRDAENQRVVARLIEAARIACRKTLDMIAAALSRRDDTAAKARSAAEQAKRRTIILDPTQHPLAGQIRQYMQLAREFLMKEPRSSMNDIDVKVAKEMLKDGLARDEVEKPIAAASPGAIAYGVVATQYAREILDKAIDAGGGGGISASPRPRYRGPQ
jgi:hypothetical protein